VSKKLSDAARKVSLEVEGALRPHSAKNFSCKEHFPVVSVEISFENTTSKLVIECDLREQTIDVLTLSNIAEDFQNGRIPRQIRSFSTDVIIWMRENQGTKPNLPSSPTPADRERYFYASLDWILQGLPNILQKVLSGQPQHDGRTN
jgi:hypothetical protein